MLRTRKHWNQIMLGSVMLGLAAMVPIILLSNRMGIGKALGCIALGTFIAGWVIAGVALVLRGVQKM